MIFCSKLLFFLRFCCFLILKPYKTKAFTASQAPNSAELELSDIRADIRIFPCSLQDCLKKSCLSCPLLLLSSPPLPLLLSNTSHLFRGRGMKAGRKEPKKEERKESKQMKEETFYSLSLSLPFLSFLLCLQAERERERERGRRAKQRGGEGGAGSVSPGLRILHPSFSLLFMIESNKEISPGSSGSCLLLFITVSYLK